MAEKNYDATVFLVMKCIMSVTGMTRITNILKASMIGDK